MRRTLPIALVLLLFAVLIYAYIDGGREDLRLIEQDVSWSDER